MLQLIILTSNEKKKNLYHIPTYATCSNYHIKSAINAWIDPPSLDNLRPTCTRPSLSINRQEIRKKERKIEHHPNSPMTLENPTFYHPFGPSISFLFPREIPIIDYALWRIVGYTLRACVAEQAGALSIFFNEAVEA